MGFGECGVQFQGPPGGHFRQRERLPQRSEPEVRKVDVRLRQPGIPDRETGIALDRLFVEQNRLLQTVPGPAPPAVTTSKVEVVRLQVRGPATGEPSR